MPAEPYNSICLLMLSSREISVSVRCMPGTACISSFKTCLRWPVSLQMILANMLYAPVV